MTDNRRAWWPCIALALLGFACMADVADTDAGSSGDGITTSQTETETETGDETPPCDWEARSACEDLAGDAHATCSLDCSDVLLTCEAASCPASCESERTAALLACRAEHCTVPPDEDDACESDCWLEFSSRVASPDCDLHGAQWDLGDCLGPCFGCCPTSELDFAYEGSCELALPSTIDPILLPYAHIELGDQWLGIDLEGTPCDHPGLGATSQGEDVSQWGALLLCPAACEVFTEIGSLRTVFSGPCGP